MQKRFIVNAHPFLCKNGYTASERTTNVKLDLCFVLPGERTLVSSEPLGFFWLFVFLVSHYPSYSSCKFFLEGNQEGLLMKEHKHRKVLLLICNIRDLFSFLFWLRAFLFLHVIFFIIFISVHHSWGWKYRSSEIQLSNLTFVVRSFDASRVIRRLLGNCAINCTIVLYDTRYPSTACIKYARIARTSTSHCDFENRLLREQKKRKYIIN